MPKDQLLRVRDSGSSSSITAHEAIFTSGTLVRDPTTGRCVIGIHSTPLKGLAVELSYTAPTGDASARADVELWGSDNKDMSSAILLTAFTQVVCTTGAVADREVKRFNTRLAYVASKVTITDTVTAFDPVVLLEDTLSET